MQHGECFSWCYFQFHEKNFPLTGLGKLHSREHLLCSRVSQQISHGAPAPALQRSSTGVALPLNVVNVD